MMDFGHGPNNIAFFQQRHQQSQQPQQQRQPTSYNVNNNTQQSYSVHLHQRNQLYNNINRLQQQYVAAAANNQVPMQSSIRLMDPGNRFATPQNQHHQMAATLGPNLYHQQNQRHHQTQHRHTIMQNQVIQQQQQQQTRPFTIQQMGNHTSNAKLDHNNQQIYANAPPKPRRYLYYNGATPNATSGCPPRAQYDAANSQLIVDLTTPRVLATTQTNLMPTSSSSSSGSGVIGQQTVPTFTNTTSLQQQQQQGPRHEPWSINQVGLPQFMPSTSANNNNSNSNNNNDNNINAHMTRETIESQKQILKNDASSIDSTHSALSSRTAPYYYSDLKSKTQQQALLNIVQQKSLSPPPQLLSRSTDQSSTRLAPKSATMQYKHARTLSEHLQHQQLQQQQQLQQGIRQKSMQQSNYYGSRQTLARQINRFDDQNNSGLTLAERIEKLFESPIQGSNMAMASSKSMLALNQNAKEELNQMNIHQFNVNKFDKFTSDSETTKSSSQFSKSKSMENISQNNLLTRPNIEQNLPVYENIRRSSKLLMAINNSTSQLGTVNDYHTEEQQQQSNNSVCRSSVGSNFDDSMDSILGSESIDDSDSNSDIIDELELCPQDNDINGLVEQLKANHSKLIEEYRSTLVRISRTINSRNNRANDAEQNAKLSKWLKRLELKSKKCESRSKNQLALIQMMERALKQSKVRPSAVSNGNVGYINDHHTNSNKSQPFPSDSDSGQPTSLECDSAGTSAASSHSGSKQSSSTSADRFNNNNNSSSCLPPPPPPLPPLNNQDNCSQEKPIVSAKIPLESNKMSQQQQQQQNSTTPDKDSTITTSDQAETSQQAKTNKDSLKSQSSKQSIIKAIVTESKSLHDFIKSRPRMPDGSNMVTGRDEEKSFNSKIERPLSIDASDGPREINKPKKNGLITKRILDIEQQQQHTRSQTLGKVKDSINSDASFGISDGLKNSLTADKNAITTKEPKSNGQSCGDNNSETKRRNPVTLIQDSDDDFIEFLDNETLSSGHHAHEFGASQFSASHFKSDLSNNTKASSLTDAPDSSISKEKSSMAADYYGNNKSPVTVKSCPKSVPVGILKNSRNSCNLSADSNNSSLGSGSSVQTQMTPVRRYSATSSLASAKHENNGSESKSDGTRQATSSTLTMAANKLDCPPLPSTCTSSSSKFSNVLGNVIDVDVGPLVNNNNGLTRCASIDT